MADWGAYPTLPYCYNPSGGASNYSVSVTAPSAYNTKGDWAEIVSSLPFTAGLMLVNINAVSYQKQRLIDIGIGAAGSESVLIGNLLYNHTGNAYYGADAQYIIPITIASGTRVAVRQQQNYNNTGSNSAVVTINFFPINSCNTSGLQVCTTLGADTSDTSGTYVDPGTSANTEGSWVQFSAALPFTARALQFALSGANDPIKSPCYWALDIGVGSAGNEVEIVKDFNIALSNMSYEYRPTVSPVFPVEIAKGQRLSVRCKCTITTATDRLLDVILYCYS